MVSVMSISKAEDKGKDRTSPSQAKDAEHFELGPDRIFFTEPYSKLKRPLKDTVAMSLEADYAAVKYEMGFVNTLDTDEPLVDFEKRVPITEKDQLDRLHERTSVRVGDKVTVMSAEGKPHPGTVTGFSYLGNSPSTVVVAADVKIESKKPDPSLFQSHGIAVPGKWDFQEETSVRAGKPLGRSNPLRQKLLDLCANNIGSEQVIHDVTAVPAVLAEREETYYFVSFWKRPDEDFEIDDYRMEACMFKPAAGDAWSKTPLSLPFQLIQVYDLDSDGRGEIFALTGDGTEICYIYLAPYEEKYRIVKRGLCAGY